MWKNWILHWRNRLLESMRLEIFFNNNFAWFKCQLFACSGPYYISKGERKMGFFAMICAIGASLLHMTQCIECVTNRLFKKWFVCIVCILFFFFTQAWYHLSVNNIWEGRNMMSSRQAWVTKWESASVNLHVASTHARWLTTTCGSASRESSTLFWPLQAPIHT